MSIRNLIAGLLIAGLLVAQEPAEPPAQEEPIKADIVVGYNFVVAPVIASSGRSAL